MLFIQVPKLIGAFVSVIGVLTIAFYATKIAYALKVKITTKQWPKNPQDFKYFLLKQENDRLLKKIETLEQENNEILNSIISQIKENS